MSERMAPNEAANDPSLPDASSDYFADYVNLVGRGRASLGLERLLTTLAGSSAQDWLGCSRKLVLLGSPSNVSRIYRYCGFPGWHVPPGR
jgi:hypothetical protein